jgi:hypothetical protein
MTSDEFSLSSFVIRNSSFVIWSRAAIIAVNTAVLAVSWMTPPPGPVERNCSGRLSIPTSQSRTCVSNSVAAGLVCHNMPCTPNPADSSSPRMDGKEALAGK